MNKPVKSHFLPRSIVTCSLLFTCAVCVVGGLTSVNAIAQTAAVDASIGHDYVVKSGDGLYKLGRDFFGKGIAYKKIVKAHNAKAATDSRYKIIDVKQGLEVGQVIWIPKLANAGNTVQAQVPQSNVQTAKPKQQPTAQSVRNIAVSNSTAIEESKLVTDYSLPQTQSKPKDDQQKPTDDPAYVVTLPKSNCEIRIWYNFQLVAIKTINQRWKEQGIGLIERAKMAHEIRHEARLNGRYMMEDKFEVAALRDRDNKKYGNPDGPTFEHLVAFGKENGLTGDRVYQGIIESSSRVQPVYRSSCVKK